MPDNRWSLYPIDQYGGDMFGAKIHQELWDDVGLWNLVWFFSWNIELSLDHGKFEATQAIVMESGQLDAGYVMPDGLTLIELARELPLNEFLEKVSPHFEHLEVVKKYYITDSSMPNNIRTKMTENSRRSEKVTHVNFSGSK